MYEYKQFHVWLMFIPFWVLHVFGAPSILSGLSRYEVFTFKKDPVLLDDFDSTSIWEEDICKMAEHSAFDIEQILSDKNPSNKCLRHLVKRLRKLKKRYSREIHVCDNRIDRMDKRFKSCIGDKSLNVEDRAWVTVA